MGALVSFRQLDLRLATTRCCHKFQCNRFIVLHFSDPLVLIARQALIRLWTLSILWGDLVKTLVYSLMLMVMRSKKHRYRSLSHLGLGTSYALYSNGDADEAHDNLITRMNSEDTGVEEVVYTFYGGSFFAASCPAIVNSS